MIPIDPMRNDTSSGRQQHPPVESVTETPRLTASVGAGFHACPRAMMTETPKRAGPEACPYEWPSDIRKALTLFDGRNPFGFPVRADTAVRPYAEDLSLNRHSRFRVKSCRGRLPRLPAYCDDRNAKKGRHRDLPQRVARLLSHGKSYKSSP